MTKWKSLASEADYNSAVDRVNDLMDVKRTDAVHNELNLLSFLIEDYEGKFHVLPDASPLEVIRFSMEMKGIKQQDLTPILGTKGNVSKILSGKANIQLNDIHPLSVLLGIPPESLIPKTESNPESILIKTKFVPSSGITHEASRIVLEPSGKAYKKKSVSNKRAAIKKRPKKKR